MKKITLSIALVAASFSTYAQQNVPLTDPALAMCPSSFSDEICKQWLNALTSKLQNKIDKNTGDADALTKFKTNGEFVDALMASPFVSAKLDKLPVDVTLKVIDIEDGDSVLAIDFNYKKEISRTYYDPDGSRQKSYKFDLNINGTATQNEEENPRNFIEASLSFSFQNMPTFDEVKTLDALNQNYYKVYSCTSADSINDIVCAKLINDNTIKPFEEVGATYYFDYGIDLGYEADQAFKAKNRRLSGFVTMTFEDMSKNSFMGINGIVPSLRVAIDTIEPNSEAPRALEGDDSSYERVSAEFHLNMPLIKLVDLPYLFSFNYRTFDELDASDIVKEANLDSYRLRTYSLSAPNGLVLSYSSGRLPFGLEDENAVELGFKKYF